MALEQAYSSAFESQQALGKTKQHQTKNDILMKTTHRRLFTTLLIGLTLAAGLGLDLAQAADKAKRYPLTKCLVSGNDLDSMGGPITKVYDGQEIKFCCKPCIKKFEANQAKYLAKLPK
jgi:YHS domain-containing protein